MTNIENQQIKELSNLVSTQIARIEAQNTRLEAQSKKLDDIQDALMGNPITKDGGLIRRLKDVEEGLNTLKKLFANYKSAGIGVIWVITALVGLIGLVVTVWKSIFQK